MRKTGGNGRGARMVFCQVFRRLALHVCTRSGQPVCQRSVFVAHQHPGGLVAIANVASHMVKLFRALFGNNWLGNFKFRPGARVNARGRIAGPHRNLQLQGRRSLEMARYLKKYACPQHATEAVSS